MEQTKGYLRLKGKIWSLNNKDPRVTEYNRFLSFGLQLDKDNSIFIQVGDSKNSTLTLKLKGEDMEQVEEVNEQDAVDRVKEVFKDGDSVYINARVVPDAYWKNLKFLVNQIYIEKEPINFDSENFEPTNELTQTAVITEKPCDRSVKAGIVSFKGELIEQELKLSDDDVNDYFIENVKVGDVLRLTISVNRKPNYIGEEESTSTRKTLKGKSVGSGSKRKIDKDNPYTESFEVIDVDIEKTERQKYDRNDIREALEKAEGKKTPKESKPENGGDLPY